MSDTEQSVQQEKPVKQRAVRVREEPIDLGDGRRGWEYTDGSIRDERGYWLAPHPGANVITKATGRTLATARWRRGREEFAAGVAEAFGIDDAPEKAMREIAKHAAGVFKETKGARGLSDLGRFIVESAGYVPPKRGEEAENPQENEPVQGQAIELLEFVRVRRMVLISDIMTPNDQAQSGPPEPGRDAEIIDATPSDSVTE